MARDARIVEAPIPLIMNTTMILYAIIAGNIFREPGRPCRNPAQDIFQPSWKKGRIHDGKNRDCNQDIHREGDDNGESAANLKGQGPDA